MLYHHSRMISSIASLNILFEIKRRIVNIVDNNKNDKLIEITKLRYMYVSLYD